MYIINAMSSFLQLTPCQLPFLHTYLHSSLFSCFAHNFATVRFTQFVVVMFLLLFVIESLAQVVGVLVKVGEPQQNCCCAMDCCFFSFPRA